MNHLTGEPAWVPPAQRDTAWYLYKELFVCNVRNFQTMTIDYVKSMGVNTSGDEEIDRGAAMSMVTIAIPISKMMDYFERGAALGVPNVEDCKRIYLIVNNHLKAWADIVQNSFNPGNVPVKDLIALDKFAASVYPHAESFFAKQVNRNTFAELLMGTPAIVNRVPNMQTQPVGKTSHRSVAGVFRPSQETARSEVPQKKPLGAMRGGALGTRYGLGLNE
jgi:hypothetical protein